MVKNEDPDQLRAALVVGPVVVAIDTNSDYIKYYKGGVINNRKF
jgi:hypothetical protein